MRRLAASAVRRRAMSSEADVVDSVRVGRATVPLRPGGSFVPEGYVESLPPRLLPTLEFLAMKDALAQDALLVCAPAERARARHAAFAYAELIRAEAFYVGVSADTTEADLRQRRELVGGGSATWSDGAPVRAALRGGVLILDGLERAERNVLPTLNNLLENREMALDDGRFLVPAARFDAFRGMLGATSSKLEAVHPNFRVVALAAPSPPFDGRPLDPPLRSRLQAGLVPGFDIAELASTDRTLTTAVAAVLELEKQAAARAGEKRSFFGFSGTALNRVLARGAAAPGDALGTLRACYPPLAGADLLGASAPARDAIADAARDACGPSPRAGDVGGLDGALWLSPTQKAALGAARRALDAGERVLLVGPRGGGKTALARKLLEGRPRAWTVGCHRDLGARDLLQKRDTDGATGRSVWRDSPLAAAMRSGGVCVLDGAHRLPKGALPAALGRALHEGVVDLPDGTRLRAAPGFAVVAVAEPGRWLDAEVAAAFSTFALPEWTGAEASEAAAALLGRSHGGLAEVYDMSREGEEATRLTTRTLLRVAKQVGGGADVATAVRDGLMARFLPRRLGEAVDGWLGDAGEGDHDDARRWSVVATDGRVAASVDGEEVAAVDKRGPRSAPELVPAVRGYVATAAAERAVAAFLRLEAVGERAILCIGNQGVGKNVAVDRYLELANVEREYAQLHRDSTVASLTATPVLEGGALRYVDAPLVRAAVEGRACVLDEADKAPTEVTVLLKALVADGELALPDGRVLTTRPFDDAADGRDFVAVHDDFRLVVLANRPGYPFHGNALFRECGDAFAPVVVENPDIASEEELLAALAPSRPAEERRRLAAAFAELRARHELGALAYPFSMRECASVARHLETFGGDDPDAFPAALANVLAHDAFAPQRDAVAEVFEAHGFEGAKAAIAQLFGDAGVGDAGGRLLEKIDVEYLRRSGEAGGASTPRTGLKAPKVGKVDETGAPHVGGNTWAGGSGGSDTAGLGGRGGPFRLWDGNAVHQVSEEAKAEVSDEARAAAKKIARKAHLERLEEIERMSERDWDLYKDMLDRIAPHVDALQRALDSAKDRERERTWLKRRSDGELDDDRLVDGVAGDRLVFKKRGPPDGDGGDDRPREDGARRKRRLLFLMDVSGSMYRFQMMDGRLSRMLEAAMLLMEALAGLDDKYEYAIRGHSGEANAVSFVEWSDPPPDRGSRLKVLQRMVAHSQFCDSGDMTVEATRRACADVKARADDEDGAADDDDDADWARKRGKHLVVALSDANFRRYGMDPLWWADALTDDEDRVAMHAVMVGSIGDEAAAIAGALPRGHGHICFDADDLPVVFKRILQHARVIDDDMDQ